MTLFAAVMTFSILLSRIGTRIPLLPLPGVSGVEGRHVIILLTGFVSQIPAFVFLGHCQHKIIGRYGFVHDTGGGIHCRDIGIIRRR